MFIAALVQRIDRLSLYIVCALAFNIVPYLVCLILVRMQRPAMALCASVLLLIVDVWLYKDLVAFQGFSLHNFFYSAVVTMYAPLWKIALVVPAGCLLGLLIGKRVP